MMKWTSGKFAFTPSARQSSLLRCTKEHHLLIQRWCLEQRSLRNSATVKRQNATRILNFGFVCLMLGMKSVHCKFRLCIFVSQMELLTAVRFQRRTTSSVFIRGLYADSMEYQKITCICLCDLSHALFRNQSIRNSIFLPRGRKCSRKISWK